MKKRFITVLVIICLLCTFTSATQAFAGTTVLGSLEESEMLTVYEVALNEYFGEREKLYTASSMAFDSGRSEELQLWKDQLDITILSADVTFSVNEVISSTASEVKIRVYEWVWINYICNGYEKVEEMGYGVDHIIRLSKIGGVYQVIADSYYDAATESDYGVAEDLAIFESERNVFEASAENLAVSFASTQANTRSVVVADSYNASDAIAYSYMWHGGEGTESDPTNYNPEYAYYYDADCCNFVSQCLAAGGMTMSGLWTATVLEGNLVPIEDVSESYSNEAWRYVPTFVNYWLGRGYYKTQVTSTSQAIPGNPIFWLKSDGQSTNHVMLIVGFNSNGQILCNSHTDNRYRMPITSLSDKKYYTLDFTHNFGAHTSQGTSGHCQSCSLCGGTTVVESHNSKGELLYDEMKHYYTCSICGAVTSSEHHSMGVLGYEGCAYCDYVEE